jgi:hypothetical protein
MRIIIPLLDTQQISTVVKTTDYIYPVSISKHQNNIKVSNLETQQPKTNPTGLWEKTHLNNN